MLVVILILGERFSLLKQYFSYFLVCAMCVGVPVTGAFAATNASDVPASCDTDMMDLMSINAGKSGRRDVELAQRILLKPDSVLEYNCFPDILIQADMFNVQTKTASTVLSNGAGGGSMGAYMSYITGSFGATYGGGTYVGGERTPKPGCSAMDAVWMFLKCENFNSESYQEDHFFRFEELASFDPREKPLACNDPERNKKWQEDNDASNVSNVMADTGP